MTGEQQAAGDTPPTITRDGSRAWVNAPLDSPYAMRLRRFGAHWDLDSARWWVGVAKATALEHLLTLPLGAAVDEPDPAAQQRSAAARSSTWRARTTRSVSPTPANRTGYTATHHIWR